MWKTLGLRFGIPVLLCLAGATYLAVPYVDRILTEWFRSDIEQRARLVSTSIEEGLVPLLAGRSSSRIRSYLARVTADQRLLAVVVCGTSGKVLYRTELAPSEIGCSEDPPKEMSFQIVPVARGLVHVARSPFAAPVHDAWGTMLIHDLSFIDRRQSRLRDYLIAFAVLATLLTVLLSVLVAWFVLRSWASTLVRDIRSLKFLSATTPNGDTKEQVLAEVREAMLELERKQRMEVDFRENWTPEALRHIVAHHLENAQMIVVSNREPYIHNREGENVRVQYPASGMVTALEPVMRACSGVWIAHGSGSADREVVDANDRLRVPPEDPSYDLRRVWITEAEEQGYYYGFANEGLWPLCHLAFVRPAFRASDFEAYREINARFADAVAAEARGDQPLVLIQDYHFALLPALVRQRLPQATIAIFWHIPWPNAEAFGICPWKRELLEGMLAADIVGFHTRYHCQNFLATVDRFMESHIDQESSTVVIKNQVCHVVPYPISIDWPPRWLAALGTAEVCRKNVFARFGLSETMKLGLGVERWDFTKGIIDRMVAIERLFERDSKWHGRLVFLQIAAPSRSQLPAYRALREATVREVERINAKYGYGSYRPIVLIGEHQAPEQVFELYRASDFCLVNSLHDGMNLVAKEYAAARDDEDGVLILSTFAGASRELVEALLVNPYDIDETAQAIGRALTMPREERRQRMRLMRLTVKENNVYRWAGRMLMDASRIRVRQRMTATALPKPLRVTRLLPRDGTTGT